MNIFLHELKAHAKSTILWSLSLSLIAVFFLPLYTGFAGDTAAFKQMLSGYPPEVLKAFGASFDMLSSLGGFYSFCFAYISLCGAVQAALLGIGVLSKETSRKTADFLFTKPAKRPSILAGKLSAVFVCLVATNIVYLAVSMLTASLVDKNYDPAVFLLISLSMPMTQMIFLALGFMLAATVKKIKSPVTTALSVVFSFYAVALIVNVLQDDKLKYISFLNYFDPHLILKSGAYDGTFIICGIAACAVFLFTAFYTYGKKDIHAA